MNTNILKPLPRSGTEFLIVAAIMVASLGATLMFGIKGFFLTSLSMPIIAICLTLLHRPMVFIGISFAWYAVAIFSSQSYFPDFYRRFFLILRYVDEMLLLPLVGILAIGHLLHKGPKITPVVWVWILLLGVIAFSGYANESGIKSILAYQQSYCRYAVFFIAASTYFRTTETDYRRICVLINALIVLQLVLNVGWLLNINPLPNLYTGGQGDWAIGSLGSSTYVSYFSVLGLFWVVATLTTPNSPPRVIWAIALSLVCFVLLAQSYTKHALPTAIIGMAVVCVASSRRRLVNSTILLVVVLAAILGVGQLFNRSYGHNVKWYEERALMPVLRVKEQVHRDVFHVLNREESWAIGMGPGEFSSVVAMWNESSLFMEYFYMEIEKEEYNPYGSIMLYPRTGILSLLGDIGLLGLALYLLMYIWPLARVFRQLWRGDYDASFWSRNLALCWCGWAVFFLTLNTFTDYLNFGITPFITWVGAGLLWSPPRHEPPEDCEKEQDAAT